MTRRYHRALIPLGLSFLGYGCSVTRPVPVAAGVHLQDVADLRTGQFSLGRTGAAIGGTFLAAGITLAILVENAQPVY
jgi:hypothetical protein